MKSLDDLIEEAVIELATDEDKYVDRILEIIRTGFRNGAFNLVPFQLEKIPFHTRSVIIELQSVHESSYEELSQRYNEPEEECFD